MVSYPVTWQERLSQEREFFVKARSIKFQEQGKFVCIFKAQFNQQRPVRIYRRDGSKKVPVVDIYPFIHICTPLPEESKKPRHSTCRIILGFTLYNKNIRVYKTYDARIFYAESNGSFYSVMPCSTALIFEPEPGVEIIMQLRRIKPKFVEFMFYDIENARMRGYDFSRKFEG